MYEDGTGVPEDWVEAARWYRKSAEQDNASGQFRLGRAYQFGIGVLRTASSPSSGSRRRLHGNAQARYFAQHLLSRGNFVGFRNEQEEADVIAGKLRTGLLWEEPVGMLFRNSGERLAYIKNLRHRVDRYEAYQSPGCSAGTSTTSARAGAAPPARIPGPRRSSEAPRGDAGRLATRLRGRVADRRTRRPASRHGRSARRVVPLRRFADAGTRSPASNRVRGGTPPADWVEAALSRAPMHDAPLTREVAVRSRTVRLDHEDPADRFLAATADVYEVTLVTADDRLLRGKGFRTLANR